MSGNLQFPNQVLNGKESWHAYFVYDVVKNETKCKLCNNQNFVGCLAFNLKRHLILKHPAESNQNNVVIPKRKSLNNVTAGTSAKKRKLMTRGNFIQSCVELIVKNMIPYRLFREDHFRLLINIHEVKYKITMNPFNIKKFVERTFECLKKLITSETKGRMVGIKADVATRMSRSVLGINIQYYSLWEKQIVVRTLGRR